MRTVFSLIITGESFRFIGNPTIWNKTSDFTIQAMFSDKLVTHHSFDGKFRSDAIVDTVETF